MMGTLLGDSTATLGMVLLAAINWHSLLFYLFAAGPARVPWPLC